MIEMPDIAVLVHVADIFGGGLFAAKIYGI